MEFWIKQSLLPIALSGVLGSMASRFTLKKLFKQYKSPDYRKSIKQFNEEEKRVFILFLILFVSYGFNLIILFSWLVKIVL